MSTVQNRYADLQVRAGRAEGIRFVVGAGGCGLAVGAGDVVGALRQTVARQGVAAVVVEGGCNGMCYAAVLVSVLAPGRPTITYGGVTPESAADLVAAAAAGRIASGAAVASAPIDGVPTAAEHPFLAGQARILSELWGLVDPGDLFDAIRHGTYLALAQVLGGMAPEAVIATVKQAGLIGRGGASFPAAIKWEGARNQPNAPKYLLVNFEEGEPGVYKDRHLVEGDPHRLVEGMVIAAYAIGAERAVVFVNGEAELAAERLQHALAQAQREGLVGQNVLGSGFSVDVEVRRGAGGYILGEETALMNAVEGFRSQPRLRPPFPVEFGLWGKPTAINNVETLANVPAILANGPEWFAAVGTARATGTKLIGISGNIARPGLVEIPMGTTLRRLIYDIGGGVAGGRELKAIVIGGPSGNLVPPSLLDVPMEPGAQVIPGTGGHIVLDDRQSALDVVRTLAKFNAQESCGKCTPCREGMPRMLAVLDRLAAGQADASDLDELRELAEIVQAASLCGLGQMGALPIQSSLRHFAGEFGGRVMGDR
ncbi:MAG: SLBB domain-containing protein [Chloroflexi bacterium]|nr:SLBB domain-containing protein [Chloroflexota bacterium]